VNANLNPDRCMHCGKPLAKGYNLCADCDAAMKAKLMAYKTQPLIRKQRVMRLWVKMTLLVLGCVLAAAALVWVESLPNTYVQRMNNR